MRLSTWKMAVLCGIAIYTRSYPHYPQEKQGNRKLFLWKPYGTDVLCRNHKNVKKAKKTGKPLDFLNVKKFQTIV